MAMQLGEVYEFFNAQNPHYDISRNSAETDITTVDYSGFKTICNLSDDNKSLWEVRMAEFKRSIYMMLSDVSAIIGNNKFIIRLNKKDDYLEVYDTMFRNLGKDDVASILTICDKHNLEEKGYVALIINFTMPLNDSKELGDENTCMMFKWVPKEEKKDEFFGYII